MNKSSVYQSMVSAGDLHDINEPRAKINTGAFFSPATGIQCLEATGETGNYINSLEGKGKPLTKNEKQFFEPKFGYDLSNVRLHTDAEANQSAKGINAKAYTSGNNIVFGNGRYNSHNGEGQHLLAHELTHVIQQQGRPQAVQRERELDADESKECLAKVDEAIAGLEKSAADPNKNLPDRLKEAIKLLREKRNAGKVKCYAFEGTKHGRVDYLKDEIQYDGLNPAWINETSVLHEAVHALHGKQFPAGAKKFATTDKDNIDNLRWKAWSEYWAYRSSQEYYNDTQKKTPDEIHDTVMKIHEVKIAVNNAVAKDPAFDPRTWTPK